MKVICLQCDKEFYKKPSQVHLFPNHYCSRDCSQEAQKKGEYRDCLQCGDTFYAKQSYISRGDAIYCGKSCAAKHKAKWMNGEEHPNWSGGFATYRTRALEKYGHRCSNNNCEISVQIPAEMLDVHHIDGDRDNNHIDNLRVICVWCHQKLTRMGILV